MPKAIARKQSDARRLSKPSSNVHPLSQAAAPVPYGYCYPSPEESDLDQPEPTVMEALNNTAPSKLTLPNMTLSTKEARDLHAKLPPTPAATPPPEYSSHPRKKQILPALPPSLFPKLSKPLVRPTSSQTSSLPVLQRNSPPTHDEELPWCAYTDPMHQTSVAPSFWEKNFTCLRADTTLECGNVTSPVAMIGLPCGGMIEMAYHYPSMEAAESVFKAEPLN